MIGNARSSRPLLGITAGAIVGLLYSAVAALILLVQGEEAFSATGTTFLSAVVVYLIGGIAGGFIAGSLLPIAKYRVGAALLGAIAALPFFIGAIYTIRFIPPRGGGVELVDGVIAATFIGGIVGFVLWEPFNGPPSDQCNSQGN